MTCGNPRPQQELPGRQRRDYCHYQKQQHGSATHTDHNLAQKIGRHQLVSSHRNTSQSAYRSGLAGKLATLEDDLSYT
jgi:hypothetical protein